MSGNNKVSRIDELFELDGAHSSEKLRAALTAKIVYLLIHDLERLLSILYRIDVRECDIKAAFAQSNPTAIAPMLADAVLKREAEKEITRAQSKQHHTPN
ncbi:MAG: hypothetical protein MUE96_05200 [Bacteroidia bacterium]|jgi:hypothetical protein|nr:hypothetical protein [Bacteroidia bacterium]